MSKSILVGEARVERLSPIMGHPNWASVCQAGVAEAMARQHASGAHDATPTDQTDSAVAVGHGDREA